MTSSITRNTSPAATQTGRCAAALPNDPGLDEILADPTLSSTAKALVTVMVKNWAWSKDLLWPCDRTLAAKVGKSVGQVQRCLQELEQAGRIRRERTEAVPNGRRIWLLWRCPGGCEGAQRKIAPVRSAPVAPARSERFVVVNEGREPEIRSESRPRPKAVPTSTAVPNSTASPIAPSPADEPITPPVQSRRPLGPRWSPPEQEMEERAAPSLQALSGAAVRPSSDPASSPAPADPVGHLAVLDLGAIGRPTTLSSLAAPRIPQKSAPASSVPSSSPTAGNAQRRKRVGLGLDLAELVKVAGEADDPILAAELARRTAPPAPPEPPPQALPTPELFAKLPGRHDLIAEATHRLAEETADFKLASWSFFQKSVEAVVRRSVSPDVLIDCRRQAMGPKAKSPGRVFVTAWKREVELRC